MKKNLLVVFLLVSTYCYSQNNSPNNYLLVVNAKNIRVWENPCTSDNQTEQFLNVGEKIRFISTPIIPSYGSQERIYRIYRNGNNSKHYYINQFDFEVNLPGKVLNPPVPSEYMITEEIEVDSVYTCSNYVLGYKKGDVLFVSPERNTDVRVHSNGSYTLGAAGQVRNDHISVYSNINRRSVDLSPRLSMELYGSVKIMHILKCKVKDSYKYYFVCQPIVSPFTNMTQTIIVDIDGERNNDDNPESSDFYSTSLDYPNYFTRFLITHACEYKSSEVPDKFYYAFSEELLGNRFSRMDEFKKHDVILAGKKIMDSIYYLRNVVYEHSYKCVCMGYLSEYDFHDSCFHIAALKKDEVGFFSLPMLSGSQHGGPAASLFYHKIFSDQLKIDPVKAKELSASHDVILVPHYKYEPVQDQEYSVTGWKIVTVADSIDVYEDIRLTNKLATLYPD